MSNNRARVTGRNNTRNMASIGDTLFEPIKPPPSARRKFSEDEVRKIRASSVPATELARALGVTPSCIRAIRHGFNYAWVI